MSKNGDRCHMGPIRLVCLFSVPWLFLHVPAALAGGASFTPLGFLLVGGDSRANAVSPDGFEVVGEGASLQPEEAFLSMSAGVLTGLGDLPGGLPVSEAFDVSDAAAGPVVVGRSVSEFHALGEAFSWSGGFMMGLGSLYPPEDDSWSVAYGVNVIGTIAVGVSGAPAFGTEATMWMLPGPTSGLGFLPGGSINSWAYDCSASGAVIVGYSDSAAAFFEAFRYEGGTMSPLGFLPGGGVASTANGVSLEGSVVVGVSDSSNGSSEAFRWEDDDMDGLGDLPDGAFESGAQAASLGGVYVVGSGTTALGQEAFIWDETYGMRNLRDVLKACSGDATLDDWILHEATGISADGVTIAGYGTNPDDTEEAWQASLPDSSWCIPCEDIRRLRARCTANGQIKARVLFFDTSHDGQQVVITLDGMARTRTVNGKIASFSRSNQAGTGSHIIALIAPDGCVEPVEVVCD